MDRGTRIASWQENLDYEPIIFCSDMVSPATATEPRPRHSAVQVFEDNRHFPQGGKVYRNIYICLLTALLTLGLAWGALVASAQGPNGGAKSPTAFADVISVNTTADENGTGASCSLREAVKTANTDTNFGGCTRVSLPGALEKIIVSAGTYTISGELVITDTILIDGAGSTTTIVKNAGGTHARIFHIGVNTPNVTIQNLTIRDGNTLTAGVFAGGGGLLSETGTIVTMNNVTVTFNTADDDGGGILNRGTMTCNNCSITNNKTTSNSPKGGGGISNDDNAQLTLNSSVVLTNTTGGDTEAHGGGIRSGVGAMLVLSNSTVNGNIAQPPGNSVGFALGGGIASEGGMTITQSTISNNISTVVGQHSGARGGGVVCLSASAAALIDRALITGNSAVLTNSLDYQPQGGGLDSICNLTIKDSIISNNSTDSQGSGGGLRLAGPTVIVNSTINGNSVTSRASSGGLGGGIYAEGPVKLVNTTVSGNGAEAEGGGIYVSENVVKLFNTTIITNSSNTDNLNGGAGGGIFINPILSAVVNMSNTVIAANLENGAGTADDCKGTIFSLGYNLVQTTSGCVVSGPGTDQLGVSALLNALTNNGGFNAGANGGTTVLTHSPQSSSPLINGGNPGGCRDHNNILLVNDERGFLRPIGRCDIGAYEYQLSIFLPLIIR